MHVAFGQKTVAENIFDRCSTQLTSLGNGSFIEREMRALA